MFFNGKIDAMDLVAIEQYEKQERQKKLERIVREIQKCHYNNIDITPICNKLKIKLTPDEFNWILEQVQED